MKTEDTFNKRTSVICVKLNFQNFVGVEKKVGVNHIQNLVPEKLENGL